MRSRYVTKFVSGVILAALCLSMLPMHVPQAQAAICVGLGGAQKPLNPDGTCDSTYTRFEDPAAAGLSAGSNTGGNQYQKEVDDIGCTFTSRNGLAICASNVVYWIMIGVFSSIAYICAFFFDLSVQLSLQSTAYALDFISTSWEIVRDLANMAFIFILLFIGISVMLNSENSEMMKTLVLVVVIALFVNFSFFFTRVAIDAGNLLAVQFYNAIDAPPISQAASGAITTSLNNVTAGIGAAASGGTTKDLTYSIMNGLKVQNLINTDSFKKYAQDPNSSSMYILITLSTIYIAMGIMFGILAGAFLYAGAKFMIRIVMLWFLIIFSPLAFVAGIIRPGRTLFAKWRWRLLDFTMYPAVFLFMFLILTKFMEQLNRDGNFLNGIFATAVSGDTTLGIPFVAILTAIANVAVRMGFVVAMLYLAVSAADILSKNMPYGNLGGGWAKAFAGWAGGGIAGGLVGALGRQSLGRVGRWTNSAGLANRTYDPRNIPVFGRTLTGFKPTTHPLNATYGSLPVNYGEGSKQTTGLSRDVVRRKEREDKIKQRIEDKKADKEAEDRIRTEAGQQPAPRNAAPQGAQPPPNNPGGGGNAPHPAPGGGGGNRAHGANAQAGAAAPNANPANQPQAQAQNAATAQASNTAITGANLQKVLQGLNTQNLQNMRSAVDTSVSRNLGNLQSNIDTSIGRNLGAMQSSVDTSISKNLGNMQTNMRVSTTNLKRDVTDDIASKMKDVVRKVVRDENESINKKVTQITNGLSPHASASDAQQPVPPHANENTPPNEIRKAA